MGGDDRTLPAQVSGTEATQTPPETDCQKEQFFTKKIQAVIQIPKSLQILRESIILHQSSLVSSSLTEGLIFPAEWSQQDMIKVFFCIWKSFEVVFRLSPCGKVTWKGLVVFLRFHMVKLPSEWLHMNCLPSWCQPTEWMACKHTAQKRIAWTQLERHT